MCFFAPQLLVFLDIDINVFTNFLGPNGIKIEDVDGSSFDRVIAVNLKGSFNVTKHSLTLMKKNNYGRVLLVASIAGKEGNAVCFSVHNMALIVAF